MVSTSRLTDAIGAVIERPVKEAVREALAEGIATGDVALVTPDAASTAGSDDGVESDDRAGTDDGDDPRSRPRHLAAGGAVLPLVAGVAYLRYRRRSEESADASTGASDPERATNSPADPMVGTAQ